MVTKTTTTVTTLIIITTTVEKNGEASTTTTTQKSRKTSVKVSEEDTMDVVEEVVQSSDKMEEEEQEEHSEEKPLKESFFGKEYTYTIEDVRDISGNVIGRVKFFKEFHTNCSCFTNWKDTDREDAKRLCIETEKCNHVCWNPNAQGKGRTWAVNKPITNLKEKNIRLNNRTGHGRTTCCDIFVKIQ